MSADKQPRPDAHPATPRRKAPWSQRFKGWWNLPRGIGLAAVIVGLAHYSPLPALPMPRLIQLHTDLAPELIGIGITLILIDWAVERRQREELKRQLIRQMGSNIRDVAVPAARELAHYEWLYDGTLKGASLVEADLSAAQLARANLSGASLYQAILRKANLLDANLNEAILVNANLSGAYLPRATLIQASLQGITLNNAILGNADLSGAALAYATLISCHLRDAQLNGVDLTRADMQNADLRSANLERADMQHADLRDAKLKWADLRDADLAGARNWTIAQLAQASSLGWATMPDGERLGRVSRDGVQEPGGLTFEAWRAAYLARHGGTETTLRDVAEQDAAPPSIR